MLQATNRSAEAEPLFRRTLAIDEKSYGPNHPSVATSLNDLALLLQDTNRLAEAEPLFRRALAINEKSYGPNNPRVATNLGNLARLLQATNRSAEAEPLFRRALAINEKSYGPAHPNVAVWLNYLAQLKAEQGDWSAAVALQERAKPSMTQSGTSVAEKANLIRNSRSLRRFTLALYRANSEANIAEGFETAQWALQTEAAEAISAMGARFALEDGHLASLARELQDLRADRESAYQRLDTAIGKADTSTANSIQKDIDAITKKIAAKSATLAKDFPEFTELSAPHPLSLTEVQGLIDDNQAVVLFLSMPQLGNLPGETIVIAITKTKSRWISVPFGLKELDMRVTTLRCGLDTSNWAQSTGWPTVTELDRQMKARQEARTKKCEELLDVKRTGVYESVPPFDAAAAYALYKDLFGGIEDLIRDKSLLIVPSGALTQLPFGVLVTEKPGDNLSRFETYKNAQWLGQRQTMTVLPSVGSLKALNTAKASSATKPYLGFGNPLLTGGDLKSSQTMQAFAMQSCSKTKSLQLTASIASDTAYFPLEVRGLSREGHMDVDVEMLRRQNPLPDTAEELCTVGQSLGVGDLDSAIYLGKRATVSQVKSLSKSGELAHARILHFATHGLLAWESATIAQAKPEPALLLTPPDIGSVNAQDNGLLTASEVAKLKLDADWVILSACNTAGGQAQNGQALSGLARAFFYAGARSLLVSHWYVNSDAAVAITTGVFNEAKANPNISRAEALRRSISSIIADGQGHDHPSHWAPFVLVGNGA